MTQTLETLTRFVPLLATIAAVITVLALLNGLLRKRWRNNADAQFRFQMIMLALSFAGLLAIILALPITDALQSQLLSLLGILLSAAIALSSTTFIGNIMAGIMLKVVRSARPGDFITVADLTGRITEMDLLHTEIQTEFRDLVTVPNLYLVTQPLRVVRASGTIIQAEVSLGYDVSHRLVSKILREAAENAGLKDGFVQVRELGDFSITYRVAGLLEDVTSLISARSELRAAALDALHAAEIEIVSPTFMNTRALGAERIFIPDQATPATVADIPHGEEIAFDKADDAASIEKIRAALERVSNEIKGADKHQSETLEAQKRRLTAQLERAEAAIKAKEADENT